MRSASAVAPNSRPADRGRLTAGLAGTDRARTGTCELAVGRSCGRRLSEGSGTRENRNGDADRKGRAQKSELCLFSSDH